MENIFLEIKNFLNSNNVGYPFDFVEQLTQSYDELYDIYLYYYRRQCVESENQTRNNVFCDCCKKDGEREYLGEELIYWKEDLYKKEQTIVASDIHGNINLFLNILLRNKIIILENSCQIVDIIELKAYNSFSDFESAMRCDINKYQILKKIATDARGVILPKFKLNPKVHITFNYLGDLIDEGKFSVECFYLMLLLIEATKKCKNIKINYLAGNHEIANMMLSYKDVKQQNLRQYTKYVCCDYSNNGKLPYLIETIKNHNIYVDDFIKFINKENMLFVQRHFDFKDNILKLAHNFQNEYIARHSMKLIKKDEMKLAVIDNGKIFIHANPSLESLISFFVDTNNFNNEEAAKCLHNILQMDNKEQIEFYFYFIKKINKFFKEHIEVVLNKLDLNSQFFTYISNCSFANNSDECANYKKQEFHFLPYFNYFVGHDNAAHIEYKFNESSVCCVDGHRYNDGIFRTIKIRDKIYLDFINSKELKMYNNKQKEIIDATDELQNRVSYVAEQNVK